MGKKKHRYIEVVGRYSHQFATPQGTVADMLRYDGGIILGEVETWDLEKTRSQKGFKMLVQSDQYTEARWSSFGLRTKEVMAEWK